MIDARGLSELEKTKAGLDQQSTDQLARLAGELAERAEDDIEEAVKSEFSIPIVPITILIQRLISRSRYKLAIEKLDYARGWLKKAKEQKTDQLKRISYKASISDSVEALRLLLEERSKGSNVNVAVNTAKQKVDEAVQEARSTVIATLVIAGGILLLANSNDKRQR